MMFTFNDVDDRDRASDDVSRYGVYLRRYPQLFASWDDDAAVTDDPAVFAAAAWQVATAPIMAPPYLDWTAERVQSVAFTHSEDDAGLIARVQVAVPRPVVLSGMWRLGDWDRGDRWNRGYHAPCDTEVARRPAMLTSALLLFHIPAVDLHVPLDTPARLTVTDAKASVKRLATLLDICVAPVLAALDDSAGVAR